MRFHTAHDIGNTTGASDYYFHWFISPDSNKMPTFAAVYPHNMNKFFIQIKECLQYVGIIIISLLSALWLMLTKGRIR